jgi:hypothetical protein
MIKSTLVTSTSLTVPTLVYTSSTTGGALGGSVTGQQTAVTTIALCNIAAPSASNELADAETVNIYFARNGIGYQASGPNCNLVVSRLTVPAGETVFFNDERIILDSGDEIYVGTVTGSLICATVSSIPV